MWSACAAVGTDSPVGFFAPPALDAFDARARLRARGLPAGASGDRGQPARRAVRGDDTGLRDDARQHRGGPRAPAVAARVP
ncbi:hypothetical protein DVK07_21960, partial [Halorubrum sp. Atlit-26R]